MRRFGLRAANIAPIRALQQLSGTCLAALVLFSCLAAGALADPVAKDARVGGDLRKTRFVADLSKPVDFRVFTLANPYRVVVDLPEVNFQMPPKLGTEGRGLISAFRYGLFSPGKSRIVIDVVKPVAVEKAFVQEAANGNPARLVIDLAAITSKEFAKRTGEMTIVGEPPQQRQQRSQPDPFDKTERDQRKAKPVVVLDPGHGGVDPGAIGKGGTMEKEVVLAFARTFKKKLDAIGKFDVFLTREDDIFIPLAERVDIAHHHNADLFISIHADALADRYAKLVRGATIYTLSEEASDEQARLLAAKENSADLIAGMQLDEAQDEVSMILLDLMRRETKNYSIAFGRTMLTKLKGHMVLNKKPMRSADFRVLRAPDIPSVLLELGYLTNPKDEKLLKSAEWRGQVAERMARAVEAFFSQREVRLPY
ncbi:N-acetylmuramoyl-L-alanine amidase [Dichotomicrobium thermohalophilum]|uniref:N-acetylmuramoyl-L-alanine amidase n=1 Tax=Dichotomicrobium thermohalophilum TaxID=933063 RepID=A0A397Q613_9HYPH|nr:N-acetylmuramoyl-L-alanine amidase [Dichotomicrobium thermohalophilum]RIA56706.1 N-acetylmuramoyl-L-alanine amidase [Dichotomicrobium thermohalophilum]